MSDLMLDVQAFVRAVGVNSDLPHTLFLGAGASISSGVPSASACMWEWKRRIFLSANPELEAHIGDGASPTTRERIQRWIDQQAQLPAEGDEHEYGHLAELCFPIADDRRRFFDRLTRSAQPYLGYLVLGLLADARVVRSVWTTNFDALAARVISKVDSLSLVEVGLDAPTRAIRMPDAGEFLHVAIHGDYRYDHLKNTAEEIQSQDKVLRTKLSDLLTGSHLVVVGFSGRDRAVMESFRQAYSKPGAGRLYWCGFGDDGLSNAVGELLERARSNGREAFYIETEGFDDLVLRIAAHSLTGERKDRALKYRAQFLEDTQGGRVKFSVAATGRIVGLIKSNLFPVECPSDLFAFEPEFEGPWWEEIRQRCAGAEIFAAPFAGRVFALGDAAEIAHAFDGAIKGPLKLTPLDKRTHNSTALQGLFEDAMVYHLAAEHGLDHEGRALYEPSPYSTQTVYGRKADIHRAVLLRLRQTDGAYYLALKPTVVGRDADGNALEKLEQQELSRAALSRQFNKDFNDELQHWRSTLFPDSDATIAIALGDRRTARFRLRRSPVFAKVTGKSGQAIQLPKSAQAFATQTAVLVGEPKLAFCRKDGAGIVEDEHPMRGIRENQPLDYPLNQTLGLSTGVRVGLVCPEKYAARLSDFLRGLHSSARLAREDEYLLDYPGFAQAFGTAISIPDLKSASFAAPIEASLGSSAKEGAHRLGASLCRAIDKVAEQQPHVTVVYIPAEWSEWEGYEDDNEWFDLHDYVKAHCVQRGFATQFIREATVSKGHDVAVLWWLALSFYAKSMRTPWAIAGGEADTAYIGIGYRMAPGTGGKGGMLLGCSHIYGTDGLGLQYRLSRIENPIFLQRNPHLHRDDARRIAELARQSFFEQNGRLPLRIAVHKRTPFLREEREGFIEGLYGVKSVDLIEIAIDSQVRYVASKLRNGNFEGDAFPVWRGTTIPVGRFEALLFGHGSTAALQGNRRFYQGRSRIPAPLRIVRHSGATELTKLAEEVLALTKMNWNNFNLYDRVPATIESSAQIARIGSLLGPLTAKSYDYRLFI